MPIAYYDLSSSTIAIKFIKMIIDIAKFQSLNHKQYSLDNTGMLPYFVCTLMYFNIMITQ